MNEIVFGAGRLGRLHYFYWNFGLTLFWVLVIYVTAPQSANPDAVFDAFANRFLAWVPYIWLSGAAATRRAHDRSHSGWFVVLLFIPVANVVAALYLTFWPSYELPNRYGPPRSGRYVLSPEELEQARVVLAAEQAENERRNNEKLLNNDGSFDMNGLFRENTLAGAIPEVPHPEPEAVSTLPPPPPPPPQNRN